MRLFRGAKQIKDHLSGSVLTIGNFDGVHLGHQALLSSLRKKSDALGLPLVVVLFEPQPSEYLSSAHAPSRLSTLREKIEVLAELQVDTVVCFKFDQKLAKTPAADFADLYLFKSLKCKYLLVGNDFRFGWQRQGDFALLEKLGVQHQCEVHSFSDFKLDYIRVSSTKIREALARGDLVTAKTYLGRDYSMCARVTKGDGRGRQWGIPTANLHLNRNGLPLRGVFCVHVKWKDNLYHAVANLGTRPTVDGTKNILEVHILDFEGELYGDMLQVFFLHKIRDEVKFKSVKELIDQIQSDINVTKQFFCNSDKFINERIE